MRAKAYCAQLSRHDLGPSGSRADVPIADFGLSNIFDNRRRMNTFCGSPLYASPEIVKGTPYKGPEDSPHGAHKGWRSTTPVEIQTVETTTEKTGLELKKFGRWASS
ncbi:hypothetical protein TNCV_4318061 [Trichonephila clavipes]|nr:hypothetical protein TNCV_4318061 [Trichonephila clavipes]